MKDQPLFEVFSTYAGHRPNVAPPGARGSPRCAGIEPWKPANLGTAAAHDKPDWLRHRARRQAWRVPPSGVPLVRMCEDMLGADQLVQQVVAEQRRRGRLDDTLLVLTSDNGMQLGEFGVTGKELPKAHENHYDLRVLLGQFGDSTANAAAYERLKAAGIKVDYYRHHYLHA